MQQCEGVQVNSSNSNTGELLSAATEGRNKNRPSCLYKRFYFILGIFGCGGCSFTGCCGWGLFFGRLPSLNALKYAYIINKSGTFHRISEDGDYMIQMGVTRTGGSCLMPPFTPTLPKGRNVNAYVSCSFLCTQL